MIVKFNEGITRLLKAIGYSILLGWLAFIFAVLMIMCE